jgi:DNA mismatch endonuclease (patch repair protein)
MTSPAPPEPVPPRASPRASNAAARARMRANRSTDTTPERVLRSALHRLGLRFRKHSRPLPGLRCTADIVFPRERVAVFMDGCFWHGCECKQSAPRANAEYWSERIAYNQARDRRNDSALTTAGWTVLRVWEHDDPQEAASAIAAVIRSLRPV